MTGHEPFEELITEKLDGVISAEGDKLLSDHLASCPECAELYRLLSGARDALAFEAEPPKELLPGVMKAVRAEKSRKKIRVRALTGALAAAAVLAAVILPGALRQEDKSLGDEAVPARFSLARDGESPDDLPDVPADTDESPAGTDPAMCYNPPGVPLPIGGDPEIYDSVESFCADYRGVAWFDSLPEEITSSAQSYRFSTGDLGYDVTESQFNGLLPTALKSETPNPAGDGYMVIIPAN